MSQWHKKLMMKAKVNSQAMANRGSLDTDMQSSANSNISNFYDYVCTQMAALSAPRETTHDLLRHMHKLIVRSSVILSRMHAGIGNKTVVYTS
jgi:hypothetical protein